MSAPTCHVCRLGILDLLEGSKNLRRVTSDCRPWEPGEGLWECRLCGTVQINATQKWREDIAAIYGSYQIYHQGGGIEQPVFDVKTGSGQARSAKLLEFLHPHLRDQGVCLDFGCGNGSFLREFSKRLPEWNLAGLEYDGKYKTELLKIPRMTAFYEGSLEVIPGDVTYDLISMVHVLEHIENPLPVLKKLHEKLSEDGRLFIQLPYYPDNPFELCIADHASHFDAQTAWKLLSQAGYSIEYLSAGGVVPKELTILASRGGRSVPCPHPAEHAGVRMAWLESVRTQAARIRESSRHFGIFGTSIAGTWLTSELEKRVDFFVDEDTSRSGKSHLGIPISLPSGVSGGSDVYIALPTPIASNVASRLECAAINWHTPTSSW